MKKKHQIQHSGYLSGCEEGNGKEKCAVNKQTVVYSPTQKLEQKTQNYT